MRIRHFARLIAACAEHYELKNCDLVIDAQNFFYDCYEDSGLHFEFGAECDRYVQYLKDKLNMFKSANIKCYFIFKGGTKNIKKKLENLNIAQSEVHPIFMNDIHVEVLKEMEFDYFFSEYESKSDCISLARKISCPVLSNDIEFPLSGVKYINKYSLDHRGDHISCELITMVRFLQKYNLNKNKLAMFIMLTDVSIFPENTFNSLFQLHNIPLVPWKQNLPLISLLSKSTEEVILNDIYFKSEIDEGLFSTELNKVKKMVNGEINSEVATNYFFKRWKITDWFVSGVAVNNIAKIYIDLYRSEIFLIKLSDDIDFTELSLNIIKYAFDLLTNFQNDGLKFVRQYSRLNTEEPTTVLKYSIDKPSCHPDNFYNTYSLKYFQHFISSTIQFDCDNLLPVPNDAKMLIITLVYIFHVSKSQPMFTKEMAHGILLSYVILGFVQEGIESGLNDNSEKLTDFKIALKALEGYFNVENVNKIMDKNILTPLKQFQYCLQEMNNLNKLCGSPYEPTSYGKTYNGTFVYNVIFTMKSKGIVATVEDILQKSPRVLEYYQFIINIYQSLIKLD